MLTLKGTVREVIRDEMDRYGRDPIADTRRDKNRVEEAELLRRLDQEVAAIRELPAWKGAEHNTLLQVNNCLNSIEAKLDLLTKEHLRIPKQQSGRN